ncbi:MAG: DUF3488 domain-containing protein [Phycisphaerales bacterium]|nr:DUF3488 domain-containing protein [Phycisphaerales bacterium]
MTSDRTYKGSIIATVLLSVLAYAYAEYSVAAYSDSPLGLAGLAIPAIALGWWLTEGRVRLTWPGWLTYIAVAAIITRGVTRAIDQGVDIAVFCEFLTLILVYKVWDHRHSRDHGQILTLCAFLAIGSILTGTSLLLGLMLAALVPLLLASVMMYQVRPDDRFALAPRSIATDPGRPRLRRAFTVSLVLLWIGSVLVFIYFPREIGFGAFGRWGQGLTTGFADRVELGRAGLISESLETVLELELRDGLDRALGGEGQVYYLRGAVLEDYRRDTGTWVRSDRRDISEIDLNPVRPTWVLSDISNSRSAPEQKITQTITLFDPSAGPLFSIWRPMDVTFLTQTGRLVAHITTLTMQRPQSSGPFRYTVTSFRGNEFRSRIRFSRDASFDSEVVREIAARVLSERQIATDADTRPVEDDARAASAIEDYLRTSFSYTLDIQAPPRGMDPIDWFLSTERRGHCEYFASAMTAMCRSVGVDARVITGYIATEWDPDARKYIVRQSNAHAWVEARGAGGVWRTYDPTPPAELRRAHQPPQDLASCLKRLFYSAENRWATGVVGYDEAARRNLVGAGAPIITWIESKMRAVSEARTPRAAREARAELRRLLLMGSGTLMALVAVLLVAPRALRWLLRHIPRASGGAARAQTIPGLGFYPDLLRALDRRGLSKPPGRPPLLHSQLISAAHPALAASVSRIAALYYRAAFGARPLSDQERAEAENLVRRIARSGDDAQPIPPAPPFSDGAAHA